MHSPLPLLQPRSTTIFPSPPAPVEVHDYLRLSPCPPLRSRTIFPSPPAPAKVGPGLSSPLPSPLSPCPSRGPRLSSPLPLPPPRSTSLPLSPCPRPGPRLYSLLPLPMPRSTSHYLPLSPCPHRVPQLSNSSFLHFVDVSVSGDGCWPEQEKRFCC